MNLFHSGLPAPEFDRNLIYYLAGPMTGLPLYNYPTFEQACKQLRSDAVKVNSPHEIQYDAPPGSLPYNDYIVAGLNLLKTCQGIILLPGWAGSRGVMTELNAARAQKMPVLYMPNPRGLSLIYMGGGK
jgi:hypothetical protein